MDRNTVIGFVLLAALLFLYLFLSTKSSQELALQKKRQEDSIALVNKARQEKLAAADTVKTRIPADSAVSIQTAGAGQEVLQVVENDVFRVTFTNKGGQPKKVELKHYNTADGKPVVLGGTEFNKFSYPVNAGSNAVSQVSELFFQGGTVQSANGAKKILYKLNGASGETIYHEFTIPDNSYAINWNIQLNGADKLLNQGIFNFTWQDEPLQMEKDVKYERQMSNVCFYEDGDFDYIQSKSSHKFESPVEWVSVAQQFFNTTLIAKNKFNGGDITLVKGTDTSKTIARTTASLQSKLPLGSQAVIPLQLYFGPNDFSILKKQAPEMDKIVNLGRDFYAFVRPINKYIVMPVFNFFRSFIGSLGLVIAFLTIFIRLLTSPLVYTSYLSGAKMKALRPEIDLLKKKHGDDQQAVGMEQMKLFREAGVNPLGGCIPALLQIPIFFALYSFFNSNIALRGESFLWATDLSSYDVILRFPVYVWGLGNHLSLFTLTAVITSFLISLYNMNMTPDQNNPALKYMPYIFPFILLFIFNSLPSALTWYYTVSNVITLILQFIIQNYIIDHDKILARIQANRSKPKVKSKWQERIEQMQEAQKQAAAGKNKK